ncbi:hypothetical protein BT69DRAFT_1288470, partial [Atractiella rhizophila]
MWEEWCNDVVLLYRKKEWRRILVGSCSTASLGLSQLILCWWETGTTGSKM